MIIPRHYHATGRWLSKIDDICPLAIKHQISLISMHVPSSINIPWYLLKLSFRNKNMGVSWADNSVKIWWNLPVSTYQVWWKSINVYSSYHPEMKYDWWTYDWWMDRHKDVQRETIIPRHYHVVGYKKVLNIIFIWRFEKWLKGSNISVYIHAKQLLICQFLFHIIFIEFKNTKMKWFCYR